jgi:hypothetical protein
VDEPSKEAWEIAEGACQGEQWRVIHELATAIDAHAAEMVAEERSKWVAAIFPGNGTTDLGREARSDGGHAFAAGVIAEDKELHAAQAVAEERRRMRAHIRSGSGKGYPWDPVALEDALDSGDWPEGVDRA